MTGLMENIARVPQLHWVCKKETFECAYMHYQPQTQPHPMLQPRQQRPLHQLPRAHRPVVRARQHDSISVVETRLQPVLSPVGVTAVLLQHLPRVLVEEFDGVAAGGPAHQDALAVAAEAHGGDGGADVVRVHVAVAEVVSERKAVDEYARSLVNKLRLLDREKLGSLEMKGVVSQQCELKKHNNLYTSIFF